MTAYLLDTNHAAQVMGGPDTLRELLEQRGRPEDRFFISITVLSELYYAAYASRRQAQNLQSINRLLDHIPLLDFDVIAAEEYGCIKAELKAKGRPIPGTDAQIAAVARLHDLTVLSDDRHLQYVDNLRVESWL
jgi:tRNA(fMet)-specific endonuclease VapC